MIKDANELKPIVDKTVKTLYGQDAKNVILKFSQQDARTKTWYVQVEFEALGHGRAVSMNITDDGLVTSTNQYWNSL
jgi:hypothetical protein